MLLGGAALSFSYSPRRFFKVIKKIGKEWNRIKEKELRGKIRSLYRSKLVGLKENKDGTLRLELTERGKRKALTYDFEKMKIVRQRWDKCWRIVIFDVPEKQKSARDALRAKLKRLGFHELQKSVFVHPFDCKSEIDFIAEFFQLAPFVRYGVLKEIDSAVHLKKIFKDLL